MASGPAADLPLSHTYRFLGIPIHRRISTGERHISWSAAFILSLVWFTWGFHLFSGGLALTFTLQRYTNDPRILAFVRTINIWVVLSPFISYTSDQVWTPWGRRRPFLIIAWAASSAAMFCFAFLPQVGGFINAGLGAVGLPAIAEVLLLVAIITGYTTLYDLSAPLEPLFLECVPPHQRGRFFAIRGILLSLAIMFFFQVLWPVYDHPVDLMGDTTGQMQYFADSSLFQAIGLAPLFAALADPAYWPSVVTLKGEQIIYIFSGATFFITGAFLLFNVTEVRVANAPNKTFRELFLGRRKNEQRALVIPNAGSNGLLARIRRIPIVGFAIGYVKDVFLTWGNYPFYIVLVIPGIEQAVWGDFGNIMQDRQFQYTKATQALWGFPMQVFTMVALTPFAGWYADTRKTISPYIRHALLLIGLALLTAAWWGYHRYAPADIRELPGLGEIFMLAGFVAFGCMAVFVWIVETMLGFTGREHTKAWVSLLALLLSLGVNICLYTAIQASAGKVIPVTLYMMLNISNGSFGALLGTFVGPMIYEYMPRSKMGTINAGRGLIGDWLRAAVMNLGGWWIVWYSARAIYGGVNVPSAEEMKYDYTSMYLIQLVLFIPAILATVYFLRQIHTRRVLKWGVLEVEGDEAAEAQAAAGT
jgi:hypothetical protein